MAANLDIFQKTLAHLDRSSGSEAGKCLSDALEVLKARRPFASPSVREAIDKTLRRINKMTNDKGHTSKWMGLALLNAIVRQCTSDVFVDHAVEWIGAVVRLVTSQDERVFHECMLLLTYVVRHSNKHSELRRELASGQLPVLLKACVTRLLDDSMPSQQRIDAYNALAECCQTFPGPMKTILGKTQTSCIASLDRSSMEAEAAMDLYCRLPLCTGAKARSSAWKEWLHKLLGTAFGLLSEYLSESSLDFSVLGTKNSDLTGVAPITWASEPTSRGQLVSRAKVMVNCASRHLSLSYPETVNVSIPLVLDVVCALLALDLDLLSGDDSLYDLAVQLDSFHLAGHQLLQAVTRQLGFHMLPYISIVSKILEQSLVRTASSDVCPKPHSDIRVACYQSMNELVSLFSDSLDPESIARVIKHIMADCSPRKATTMELESPSRSKHTSKKRKRAAIARSYTATVGFTKHDPRIDSEVCLAALSCLKVVLYTAGSSLPPKCRLKVDEFLLAQVSELHRSIRPPFDVETCRARLYECLVTSVVAPSPVDPRVSEAIALLRLGVSDNASNVASQCREALVLSDLAIHPRFPAIRKRRRHTPHDTEVEMKVMDPPSNGSTGSESTRRLDTVLAASGAQKMEVDPSPQLKTEDMSTKAEFPTKFVASPTAPAFVPTPGSPEISPSMSIERITVEPIHAAPEVPKKPEEEPVETEPAQTHSDPSPTVPPTVIEMDTGVTQMDTDLAGSDDESEFPEIDATGPDSDDAA